MKTNIFLIVLAALVLASCSGIKVTADYDKTVDFTKYKTFAYYGWIEESDKDLSPFDKKRIEEAFAQEFKSRGLELVKENADLVVALFIVEQQKTQTTATTTGTGGMYGYGGYYGYGPGWGWGGGHSTTTYSDYDYTVGTLVCDVFDASKKQLVWEGVGTKTISENPQKREKSIPVAVKAIMAKYPVQPLANK